MGSAFWLLSVLGYAGVILGSTLLYKNATPYMGLGRVPVLKPGEASRYFSEQDADLDRRRSRSRWGFSLLLSGCILQFLGLVVAAVR